MLCPVLSMDATQMTSPPSDSIVRCQVRPVLVKELLQRRQKVKQKVCCPCADVALIRPLSRT